MKTVFKFVLIICALAGNPVFADSITWFVNGLDNSPVATMNESGHLLAKESYNPYGKKRLNHSLNRDEIGYTGHQHDHVTGLTYAQQRYYHPDIGFYSVDPIPWTLVNPVHSFNRYVYANNNPFRYNDPDGQFGNFVVKGLVDLGLNIAINLATTGKVGFVSAVKETISSAVDPTKTVKKVKRLRKLVVGKGAKREKEYGSYTNTHASGNKYHGQGNRKRSQTSGKERAAENDDPHVATDWTSASNRREAMKDEARRIQDDGGIENTNNYNKINSPGKKYLDKDGG